MAVQNMVKRITAAVELQQDAPGGGGGCSRRAGIKLGWLVAGKPPASHHSPRISLLLSSSLGWVGMGRCDYASLNSSGTPRSLSLKMKERNGGGLV